MTGRKVNIGGLDVEVLPDDEIIAKNPLYVCNRVSGGPSHVPSDEVACSLCGEMCWVSKYSGAPLIARGLTVICIVCALNTSALVGGTQ